MHVLTGLQVLDRDRDMDSSSSSSSSLPFPAPLQEKYALFLSFKGEDTCEAVTSHLHAALLRKQIETYIDNRLEKGDDIGPSLKEAIKKSKIALVIFCRIDPSDVRKQQGTYALEDHPVKRSRDEVANWRATLEEAANMSGFHYSSKTGTEADFVEKVVQDVLTKLNRESSSDLKGLVGIEKKIEAERLEKSLEDLTGLNEVGSLEITKADESEADDGDGVEATETNKGSPGGDEISPDTKKKDQLGDVTSRANVDDYITTEPAASSSSPATRQ